MIRDNYEKLPVITMLNTCKMQLAVVDWSQWRPQIVVFQNQKDMICRSIPCELELDTDYRLHNGDIVYINGYDYRNIRLNGDNCKISIATVWVPKRKEFLSIVLNALHPIVSEDDVIEMELKFGIDLHSLISRDI